MICNLNGRFVSADDPLFGSRDGSWRFGDSLFETMKARDGQIRFLERHLDRLQDSANLIDFPCDRDSITAALNAALQQAGPGLARIRLTLGRGNFTTIALPDKSSGYFLIEVTAAEEPDDSEQRDGVRCIIAPNRRVNPLSHLPQMKRGNYADCLYAANFARSKGAREALFLTRKGLLLEGATSNIFLIRDETLLTPILGELVLPGIIRGRVLELAGEWEMRIETREISLDELYLADEAFISNSMIDVLPVATVDEHSIRRGPLAQKFLAALKNENAVT
ncbi:MAG: hypothetical protein C0623_06545 [Desulfuromonas sp.]|nr:MAG: hypothetical protein C0623_06545 [Desulfuromonas sp.]